jgi:hypothetical protein
MRITKEEYDKLKQTEQLYKIMSKWIANNPKYSMEYLEYAWKELDAGNT